MDEERLCNETEIEIYTKNPMNIDKWRDPLIWSRNYCVL